jgi:transcriptional regulator PpsR
MESHNAVSPVKATRPFLAGIDAESTRALVELAADIVLVMDPNGAIVDLVCSHSELISAGTGSWVGRDWLQTVSPQSRPRLEALLRDAAPGQATEWRQVTHPSLSGATVAVQYRAIRLAPAGIIVAVGRDLQAVASLQQQLVDAQQALEHEYWRFRELETRYRLLFQLISEAILVVEGATHRIVEANPAAGEILGSGAKTVVGKTFPEGFDDESAEAIKAVLARGIPPAKTEQIAARRRDDSQIIRVSLSLLQQGQTSLYLVRLVPAHPESAAVPCAEERSTFDMAVTEAPDAILITDLEGRIVATNPAFMRMAQLPQQRQPNGESLDRWLGRPGIDLKVLTSNLQRYGSIRLFKTTFHTELGATSEVEISAALLKEGERPFVGFFIRDIGRRLVSNGLLAHRLPQWFEGLTERVGRVPLKELVRESTDIVERLCIDAALKLTGDNRASAAELLGLSRQSLYVKLARYGLGGDSPESTP